MMAYDFEAIRAQYPLDEIVAREVQLRRAGGNKIGCCPFHPDKTPSFVVYQDQTYHCFGCGVHGDVIDFVATMKRLDTKAAIGELTGGEIPSFDEADRAHRLEERQKMEARQRRNQENATLEARGRWARALPINGVGNAYLERKGVAPYGTRREGDNLLVPIYGADGLIMSVQAIPPEPGARKLFHGGAPVAGGTLALGDAKTGPVVIVEGFATGATVQAASGLLVIVGFSKAALRRTAEIAAARYPGREILIGADANGIEAAEEAAAAVGGRVVIPDMRGADGSDFNDQATQYGLEDVAALFTPVAAPSLPVLHPADWQGKKAPERQWVVEGLIPDHQATLLTGAGAAGKSLVTQLLSTCIGAGAQFLGLDVEQRPALYITCEDDADELHRREDAICAGLRLPLEQTRGNVFLLSLYGELGNELCTFDDKRTLHVAERYRQIVQTAHAVGAKFIVLDNTSHLFTGNENARSEVAAFVNLCNALAREIGGAVIIVGFPNKAGDSYSGSTAWENQVRSRLFMEIPKNEDGAVVDPDYRVLRNEKANYARRGAEIGFVWSDGTFILPPGGEEDAPVSHNFTDRQAMASLREIDKRWRAGNPFSAAHNSPERYLGSWLQLRFRLTSKAASAQIRQWGAAGFIVSEQYDSHSKKSGLRVVDWPNTGCGSAAEVNEGGR